MMYCPGLILTTLIQYYWANSMHTVGRRECGVQSRPR